jgi:4-amino-4-deoxy-L-arabinose transferase-like glycosyltransferase
VELEQKNLKICGTKCGWSTFIFALVIFVSALILTVPFLGSLEFFRHTEADRALIGWEMLKSANWLVPHLLGDTYLTKPPLFYQYLAAIFAVTGEPSEFAARLSSALAFAALVALQFVFATYAKLPRLVALLSAIAVAASAQFFTASMEAEIDLTLTLFTTISTWLAFFAVTSDNSRAQTKLALGAGIFAALGFLVKGPPGLFFPFAAAGVFYIFCDRRVSTLLALCIAGVTSLVIVGAWVALLAREVSAETLWYHFNFEVLQRVKADPLADERARPITFYLGTLFAGALPATLLIFLPAFWRNRLPGSDLTRFCLALVVPSLLIFSCASGKSSRYLLPLVPFLITWLAASSSFTKTTAKRAAVATITIFLAARLGYSFIYAPQRNAKLSVRPIAEKIHNAGYPRIYILEMFERWLPYYLIRSDVEVLRLTPPLAASLQNEERYDLLLSSRSEGWRMGALLSDPQTTTNTFTHAKGDFVLARVPGRTLKNLALSELFPTVSTAPAKQIVAAESQD